MTSTTKTANHLHIVLPANLNEVDQSLLKIMQFLKESPINLNFFNYNYIIREALNNAVIHGSHNDANKKVFFDLHLSSDAIDICIEDEGDGFDWQAIAQKELVKSSETHGRGLFCMSRLHFETSYNKKGNILYLHQELPQKTLKRRKP